MTDQIIDDPEGDVMPPGVVNVVPPRGQAAPPAQPQQGQGDDMPFDDNDLVGRPDLHGRPLPPAQASMAAMRGLSSGDPVGLEYVTFGKFRDSGLPAVSIPGPDGQPVTIKLDPGRWLAALEARSAARHQLGMMVQRADARHAMGEYVAGQLQSMQQAGVVPDDVIGAIGQLNNADPDRARRVLDGLSDDMRKTGGRGAKATAKGEWYDVQARRRRDTVTNDVGLQRRLEGIGRQRQRLAATPDMQAANRNQIRELSRQEAAIHDRVQLLYSGDLYKVMPDAGILDLAGISGDTIRDPDGTMSRLARTAGEDVTGDGDVVRMQDYGLAPGQVVTDRDPQALFEDVARYLTALDGWAARRLSWPPSTHAALAVAADHVTRYFLGQLGGARLAPMQDDEAGGTGTASSDRRGRNADVKTPRAASQAAPSGEAQSRRLSDAGARQVEPGGTEAPASRPAQSAGGVESSMDEVIGRWKGR